MSKNDNLFFLLLFIAMLLWAGSWVSGRLLSIQADPLIIMFWRFLFTFLAFLPPLIVKRKELAKIDLPSFLFTLGAAVLLCVYNICFLSGLQASLAGKGGVIVTTTNPLFAFMISVAVLRQQTGRAQILGLLLGISGGIILVEPWTWQTGTLRDWSNMIFLAAAFTWAVLTFLSRGAQKKLSPFIFNPLLYLLAMLLSILLLPENWRTETRGYDLSFWLNVGYLAFAAGAIGAGMYFWATTRLGAAKASTMTFMVPVLALLLSWILLREQPQWETLLGGALSIVAVFLINGRIRIRRFQTSG